ncbi:MAG: hypothetical protein IPK17_01570 [Chloroflexi bacterium]|uniref:FtsK/SpoIIIE domain-containing protein n=1 Tax=Candidatus Flexifilum breve TaxID=3140694 RepID=UPI0031346EEB|nr:hypothetical protein [Chloroflexota bacterium]
MNSPVELDDALPKPGEPLTPAIDPANLAVLEEDLEERKRRLSGKLSKRDLSRLRKRYHQLWQHLTRVHWNDLIIERWQLHQKYQELKFEYQQAKTKAKRERIGAQAQPIHARGRELNAEIRKHQALADEFENIKNRLTTHQAVIQWEREEAENYKAFKREARVWEDQIKAALRQTRRCHHAGYDEQNRWFCHIPKIQDIVFKPDKVLFQIAISEQNIFGKWRSALPYNVDITALASTETLENLKGHTNRVVSVVRGEKGQNFFYAVNRPDSPDGIPKRVLYAKVMPWYPVDDHAKTPWPAGVTADRKTKWYTLEEVPHTLIVGTTKSGKSNQVNQMIATFATMNSPRELRMILIDNKGGMEFTHWKKLKHLARPMIKNIDDVLPTLEWLNRIMKRRITAHEAIMAKTLEKYNSKVTPESRLPRIVIIIDELATLMGMGALTTEIQNALRDIASQGRAVGIHLVVCTQHVNAEMLPGWIQTNMTMRIAGYIPGIQASFAMIGSTSAAQIPQDVIGRLVFAQGRMETICQSPYISDEEIADSVVIANKYPDPDNREFEVSPAGEDDELPAVLQPVEKFTRYDLIKVALEQFEGRLPAKRIHEVLGNEVVPRRRLEKLVAEITSESRWVFEGTTYDVVRDGKTYALRKATQFHTDQGTGDSTIGGGIDDGDPEDADEIEAEKELAGATD